MESALCLGQIVILVLACVHTTPPPSKKGPLLRFFLRGGGSVHRLFSACALGRLSFQFRIPTKPRIRTLAKMSSFSLSLLHLLHLDKWQLAKCDVISSMYSVTNTFSSTLLLGPHSVYKSRGRTAWWNSRKSHFLQLISSAISLTKLYLKLAPVAL